MILGEIAELSLWFNSTEHVLVILSAQDDLSLERQVIIRGINALVSDGRIICAAISWHIGIKTACFTFAFKELNRFRRDKLGFIFQDFNLIDTLTAYENIALALSIQRKEKDMKDRIRSLAHDLDIEDVLNNYPHEMSGGQKQRVAAARALITSPSLILADEPTGALDSTSSRFLLEKMLMLNKDYKATILMVTHDAFSASYANRVIFIKDGKIFHEIYKGEDDRKTFFNKIIDVETMLGGDLNDL